MPYAKAIDQSACSEQPRLLHGAQLHWAFHSPRVRRQALLLKLCCQGGTETWTVRQNTRDTVWPRRQCRQFMAYNASIMSAKIPIPDLKHQLERIHMQIISWWKITQIFVCVYPVHTCSAVLTIWQTPCLPTLLVAAAAEAEPRAVLDSLAQGPPPPLQTHQQAIILPTPAKDISLMRKPTSFVGRLRRRRRREALTGNPLHQLEDEDEWCLCRTGGKGP